MSVDYSVGVCSCGKVQYATRADAKKVKNEKGWRLTTYECCGYFHIGHPDKRDKLTRRARARRGR